MKDPDNIPSNPSTSGKPAIDELIQKRIRRRTVVGGLLSATGMLVTGCYFDSSGSGYSQTFSEISRGLDDKHHIPEGYQSNILMKWGDHLFDSTAEFDPYAQSEAEQLNRFGFNNDYIGFLPLNQSGTQGLLCINHEYTSPWLMFPNVTKGFPDSMTYELAKIEMAAQGGSIVEVKLERGGWHPVIGSKYNRRITPHETPMQITGPASGHKRLQTSSDITGSMVAGTMNNCAGGITPWGSWLMAEENFNLYFLGNLEDDHPEARNHKRYGLSRALVNWGLYEKRFNIEEEPTEPNRFGWIVEVDPLNPNAMPKKRTALGRFKHEGAETVLAPDGRVVVYMGDDQRFDYVYKFISKSPYESKGMNENLLDEGTLYVARFNEDGTVDWLPLIFGQGPLTIENDFDSQAEVLIETRRAADLLGATPMDRPEDIQPDATTGRAWVMLTNNDRRTKKQTDKANPRADNQTGHIIEIIEPNKDFAATRSRWEILVKCGDPSDESNASWHVTTTDNGWFGSPDNAEVDEQGRLWVSTDGNQDTGAADGIWMIETNGYARGKSKAFFRAPLGAEVSGPQFSPDFRTLFLAVQHPGDTEGSNFENPATRWPDFDQQLPPRPSIIAVRRDDNQKIGT